MALTKRQKEVLDFLVSFLNKHGYSPSFEEMAKSLKLTSLATVHKHITTLEKKGFIRRGYNQSRSIEVTQLPKPVREQVIARQSMELPLAGRIAAGRPLEAVEERETISLGDFAHARNCFVLQVKGNSMIEGRRADAGGQPRRDRGRAGARQRSDAETLLPRSGRKNPFAAGQFGIAADCRPGARCEDSGPRHQRVAQVLSSCVVFPRGQRDADLSLCSSAVPTI